MRTTGLLRQLLRSFCRSMPWKYAVFWKLKHHGRMLLTWEDGYCENSEPEIGHFSITPGSGSLSCKTNVACQGYIGSPIALAVERLSSHLYSLGNGIIGSIASVGMHRWITVNQVNSQALAEYPEEWQLQIAAGIKTILLVPVSHGVLQLGSFEKIAEDCTMVASIQELFNSFQDSPGTFSQMLLSGDVNPIGATRSINFSASLASTESLQTHSLSQMPLKKGMMGPAVGQAYRVENSNFDHKFPHQSLIHDGLTLCQTDIQNICIADVKPFEESLWEREYNSIAVVPDRDLQALDQSNGNESAFSFECKSSIASSQYNAVVGGMPTEQEPTELHYAQYDNCYAVDEMIRQLEVEVFEASDIINVPLKSDLGDNVWAAFLHGHNDFTWDGTLGDFWLGNDYSVACQTEEVNCPKVQVADHNGLVMHENELSYLLDAVVTNPYHTTNGKTLNVTNSVKSPSNSSEQFVGSCLTQNKHESDVLEAVHSGCLDNAKSGFLSGSEGLTRSPIRSSSNSGSLLINEDTLDRDPGDELYKTKKSVQTGKKRQKAGDIHKPRPRDRQLIQDRVKQLRGLVPNAAKCSIDSLLDRTIKHMLFLRSVSCQAEKLKNCAHKRVSKETDSTGLELHQNGATWAYELGSQPEVCPLLVENMEQPGHLLIEMLCAEYGDFLEIAQVIRHSELTILKGIMESRSNKLWAHFIVEASRGFDRMDILWPLMRLMQKNGSPIPSKF